MRKLLFFISAIIVPASILHAQQTDRQKDNLIGNVKSVQETHYKGVEKFGEVVTDKVTYIVTTEYNKEGYMKEFEFNDVEDKEKTVRTYKHNEKNLVVEEKEVDDGETTISKAIYNANDKIIESNEYDKKGNLKSKTKYKYDEQGRLLRADVYTADGALYLSDIYEYGFYMGDGVWKSRVNKKYKMEEHWVYDLGNKDGKPPTEIRFEGEAKKNSVTHLGSTMYFVRPKDQAKTSFKRILYTYNAKGLLVNEEWTTEKNYTQSSMQSKIYEYDKYGNRTLEKDSEKYYTTYTYTYDATGNWIKKVETRNSYGSVYHYISERKIKYY